MMNWIFCGMIVLSMLFAALTGKMEDLSNAAMGQAGKAVELVLQLMGTMCLWSGIMRVADEAGLTKTLSRLLRPVTARLFRGIEGDSPAMRAVSLNLTANLLGLGNAATPLGIAAMQQLHRQTRAGKTATDPMVLFVVLNTASLQLLPTTTAYLRLLSGSAAPMDILPAVWLSTAVSVTGGVVMAKLLSRFFKGADR